MNEINESNRKAKVIAVFNQKGGCGKTATCINLAMGLARHGKKILAIDCDPQGDMTISLGYRDNDSLAYSVKNVFEDTLNDLEPITANYEDYLLKHEEKYSDKTTASIDLLPANIELAPLESYLVPQIKRETILREFIDAIRSEYDYILIDCSPSLGLINLNAIVACDEIIIPMETEFLSTKGLLQLMTTIKKARKGFNKDLKINGILFTLVKNNVNIHKGLMNEIRTCFGDNIRIFDVAIPSTTKVTESNYEGISLFKHAKNNPATLAYEKFVCEVLDNE